MTVRTIAHDPQSILDYGWDWRNELDDGETIASATASSVNVTVSPAAIVGTQTVAWGSGGTSGKASIRFHIVTSEGREFDRTLPLWVRDL